MMFAGRCGMYIMLDDLCRSADTANIAETLFNEELGAVNVPNHLAAKRH